MKLIRPELSEWKIEESEVSRSRLVFFWDSVQFIFMYDSITRQICVAPTRLVFAFEWRHATVIDSLHGDATFFKLCPDTNRKSNNSVGKNVGRWTKCLPLTSIGPMLLDYNPIETFCWVRECRTWPNARNCRRFARIDEIRLGIFKCSYVLHNLCISDF